MTTTMTTDTTTTMTETMTRAQLESILIQPLTERWLAEQLGVAIPTIHRWSNGHEPIPPAVPSEISRVLDTLSDELAATARPVRGEYGSLTFETEWRGVRYTSTDTSPKFLSERLESVLNGRLETIDVGASVRLGTIEHFHGGMMLAHSRQGASLFTPWRDEALRLIFSDAWEWRTGTEDVFELTLRAFEVVGLATASPA